MKYFDNFSEAFNHFSKNFIFGDASIYKDSFLEGFLLGRSDISTSDFYDDIVDNRRYETDAHCSCFKYGFLISRSQASIWDHND